MMFVYICSFTIMDEILSIEQEITVEIGYVFSWLCCCVIAFFNAMTLFFALKSAKDIG